MNKIKPLLLATVFLVSCAEQQMTVADKAYDRMAYAKAACNYEKALGRTDDRAAALRAADSYSKLNQPAKAADWYAYAARTSPLDAEDALAYGQSLLRTSKVDEALVQFNSALAADTANALARKYLLATGDRDPFYLDTNRYSVSPMPLNGIINAFSAAPYMDGIVFVGEKDVARAGRNPWSGLPYLDLFTSKPTGNGAWSMPTPVPGTVNGRFHEGPVVFNADGTVMYFTRSDYYKFRLNKDENSTSHLVLFRAELLEDGTWGNIHLFMYNGDSFSCGHPALSADGNVLYYISDMPGGEGGTDIYRCSRTADGWTIPENLGPPINTPGNEMFPTMYGDTLFFASNGHLGMGGLDVYSSYAAGGEWTMPVNLKHPINSEHDDFSFMMLPGGMAGYLSSNRNGTDQVYSFLVNEEELNVSGTFAEFGTDELLEDVEVRLLDLTEGKDIGSMTGADGSFTFPLETETDYRIIGSKDGLLTETRQVSTKGHVKGRAYKEDFLMHRIDPDVSVVVDNIYYDLDEWDIRDDAAVELDKLAVLFKANPEVRFELSSHTDSRASSTYNLVLSEARAKAAVDHLIRQGVDPLRITAKGYGESRPVNHCRDGVECTDDQHQANRRTEFRVIGVGNMVYEDRTTRTKP